MTDQELLAAQQAQQPPPGAVAPPVAPPIEAPQSSPEDALALAAPAPAPPAPGMPVSPRDQLIMGDEGPMLGPPAPTPTPGVDMPATIGQSQAGEPAKSPDGIQEGLDTVKADREKTNEALISQHEGEAEKTHAEAEAATERRKAAEETARKEAEAAAHYDAAEKQAQADTAQTKDALAKFKFRDLWASKTTVQKVGTALSSALLAIGAGMMKTPKYAIEILDKEKDDDYKQQVDHLNQLKDADVMARTGLNDVRAARGRAMADITMAAAQKDRVIAAQFEETALRAKDQNSAQEGMAYAAKLKQDADEKDLQAHIQIRNLRLQDAATLLKQQEEQARTRELDALTAAANARANGTGGYAKHGKGGGGGGSGVGHGEAAEELARLIREGKDENGSRRELSQDEKIHEANRLHIPLNGKPSQVTLTSINAGSVFNKNQAIKDARSGLQEKRFDEAAVKNFASEHQLPKLEAAHRKLEEVRSMLNSGNPVAAMSALMEYDAAAKGSSATESSMHAIQGRLGGAWDRFKGAVARQDSGAFGETERKNLSGAIDEGIKSFKESVEPIHKAYYEKFDGGQPGVKNSAASLFRPFGYEEKGGGSGGGDMVTLTNKKTGETKTVSREEAKRMGAL